MSWRLVFDANSIHYFTLEEAYKIVRTTHYRLFLYDEIVYFIRKDGEMKETPIRRSDLY
jgi:hypothetical protein